MANSFFRFKQFTIHQDKCAMKVTTDSCLFGALLPEFPNESNDNKALDIGTGTGLLTLMFAQKNPKAIIDTIEIDQDAFEQAAENIAASPWNENIRVINGDIKEFNPPNKYDLIFCNPPFYINELKAPEARKNIAHHGDKLQIAELLVFIKRYLTEDGIFCLLLPYKRYNEIKTLIKEFEMSTSNVFLIKQSPDHNFFRAIIYGNKKKENNGITQEVEIRITDMEKKYTHRFTSLLKDYYLHL